MHACSHSAAVSRSDFSPCSFIRPQTIQAASSRPREPAVPTTTCSPNSKSQPVRVCIVGGGAAGLSAAWSLSRYPDKFSVEVWEAGDKPGGVASTVLDLGNGLWVNEQVQGGFQHSYANTLLLLKKLDIKPQATWPGVRLSVGNATLHHEYWDNFSDQASFPVLERHATETARFLELLRSMMQGWRQALGVLPIGWLLRMLRFSNEFQRDILYPLLVTLNGTGNQMARTPSAVVANILMHPIMRVLGPGSQARLLAPHSQGPQHFIFSNLQQAYAQLAERIAREPGCSVHCSTPVSSMSYCKAKGGPRWRLVSEAAHREGVFDKVIFTCGPEATLKLLATSALPDSWLYRFVFNRFEVYDVSIITHTDEPYIRRHYGLDPSRPEELPLWMVRWVRQRAGSPGQGLPQAELSYALSIAYKHWNLTDQLVFQTNIVQDPGIDPSKVLSKRTARHVAMTFGSLIVPSLTMGRLQDRHGALFAGAYMMGNPHEAAVTSGLAAAERLGAPYPFKGQDADADYYHAMVMAAVHGQGSLPLPDARMQTHASM